MKLKPTIPNLTYALIELVIDCGDKLLISKTISNVNAFGYSFIKKPIHGIELMSVRRNTIDDDYHLAIEVTNRKDRDIAFTQLLKTKGFEPLNIAEMETFTRYCFSMATGIDVLTFLHETEAL